MHSAAVTVRTPRGIRSRPAPRPLSVTLVSPPVRAGPRSGCRGLGQAAGSGAKLNQSASAMTSPLGAGVPEAGWRRRWPAGPRAGPLPRVFADQPPRVSAVGDYLERVSAYPRLHYGRKCSALPPGRCHGAGDLAQEGALRDPGHRTGPGRAAAARRLRSRALASRPAMSRWPGWNAGSQLPSPAAMTAASGSCAPLCRLASAAAAPPPPAGGRRNHLRPLVGVRRHVRAAISLLELASLPRDLTLATAQQGDLDTWIASRRGQRLPRGRALRPMGPRTPSWLVFDFPATRWNGPASAIDTEARWEQARQLLHDDTLKPDDLVRRPAPSSSTPNGHR